MVFADYLRSHFSVSQPKALRSRARGYLSELRRATCHEEFHLSFCFPFCPTEFFAAVINPSLSTAPDSNKVAYPMLKHLPRSGVDFLLQIFNIFWSLHSFPSVWKTSIVPIHKMRKPLDSPAFFRPISLNSYISKRFERIILFCLLFFLESNSILSPHQVAVSNLEGLRCIKFCSFLNPFWIGLTNPARGLGRFSLLLIYRKLLTLSGIPPFSINSFRLVYLLALLVGLNLFFLISALEWFIKITKVAPFESVEVFRKDPFLALYFSLSSSMIFLLLCLLPSAALFKLTIWPFGLLPLGPQCGGDHTKSSVSIGALV